MKELEKQKGVVEEYKKLLTNEKTKLANEESVHKKQVAEVAA